MSLSYELYKKKIILKTLIKNLIFENLFYNIEKKINDLFILKYFKKWKRQINNLKFREQQLEKLDNALYCIELRMLIIDIGILEKTELIKNIITSINVARAYDFFYNLKNISYNKNITFKLDYNGGLIILKNVFNNILKKYFTKIKEEKYNKTIIELNNKIKMYEDLSESNNALKMIISKDNEIKELKESLSRFPFQLSEGEKLMSVIFSSMNQEIHCSIICKNTDYFSTIVNSLYNKYPKYRNDNYYFMCNGNKILEYKKIKNLHIEDGDVIMLVHYD